MIPRHPAPLKICLFMLPLALALAGCNTLRSIEILPEAGATVLTAVGQTAQFTAVGTGQGGSARPTTANITPGVTWSVNDTNVATINSAGIVTAVGAGYTEVYAASDG